MNLRRLTTPVKREKQMRPLHLPKSLSRRPPHAHLHRGWCLVALSPLNVGNLIGGGLTLRQSESVYVDLVKVSICISCVFLSVPLCLCLRLLFYQFPVLFLLIPPCHFLSLSFSPPLGLSSPLTLVSPGPYSRKQVELTTMSLLNTLLGIGPGSLFTF